MQWGHLQLVAGGLQSTRGEEGGGGEEGGYTAGSLHQPGGGVSDGNECHVVKSPGVE